MMLPLFATGCGNGMESLSGKVTVQGKIVPEGTISFRNKESGTIAVSVIEKDGSYSVKTGSKGGLKAGEYEVTIAALKGIHPPATPENPYSKFPRWSAARYADYETSGLTLTVRRGSNVKDFDLGKE